MVDASGDESGDGRCRYSFDASDRDGAGDEDFLDEEGQWHCPHAPVADRDRCPFHLPPDETPEGAVERRLEESLERPGASAKQFVGARLDGFDARRTVVESADNHPLDFRYATFSGETTLEYAIVRQPLNLEYATFEGRVDFTETRFRNEVYLSGATFRDEARWFATRFTQGVWCYDGEFAEANVHRATFGGPADFTDARFGSCHLPEATFESRAEFDGATFEHASFTGARFAEIASFDGAAFPERATFTHCEFADVASFDEPEPVGETSCLDLREATVTAGTLRPPEAPLVFDLHEATVGEVTVAEGELRPDLLDRFRFLNTTFAGFDFGAYRGALNAAEWEIHHVEDVPGLVREGAPSAGELESTYLKAKNGANTIGDTKAAAEFFREEMLYRRHQYVPTVRSAPDPRDRVVAAWRWGANALLDVTAGYGERPSRVVASSVVVVALFVGLFAATTPGLPYESPVGYLILSLESFITLVLGGAEQVTDPGVRLLAQVEGFVGAFLIALFVFTLTRSIHR